MGELTSAIQLLHADFSTAILRYPTGRFGLVGNIPLELTRIRKGYFGDIRDSMVWDTEQEVIDALLAIGCTKFQLADCSWYKEV